MIIEQVYAQTDRLINTSENSCYYFIAAHTINGARFYSPTYKNVIDALTDFRSYEDTVRYFNGGMVELFKIDVEDFDIIAVSRV